MNLLKAQAVVAFLLLAPTAKSSQPTKPDPFPSTLNLRVGDERRYKGYSIYMPDPTHVDGSSRMTFEGQVLVVKALKPGKSNYKLSAYGTARRGDMGWKKVRVEVNR